MTKLPASVIVILILIFGPGPLFYFVDYLANIRATNVVCKDYDEEMSHLAHLAKYPTH